MPTPRPPLSAGLWLGLGLGGFVDGIVFHQVLQWHHLFTSAGHPADTLAGLQFNTLWDGVFHAATWLFVVIGLARLWQAAQHPHPPWPARGFVGDILLGFGLFNLVEGLVDHHLLGIHHVNETVPPSQWIWWDLGFLASGALLVAAGLWLRKGRRRPT